VINEGAGKVYVKYFTADAARKCLESIVKRKYNGR
jgi:hypothetical protein